MPPTRRKIMEALIAQRKLSGINVPASTVRYAVEELEAQGLLVGRELSDLSIALLQQAAILPSRSTDQADKALV
jgi:hypothetical protein